jgi:hypothetical protein
MRSSWPRTRIQLENNSGWNTTYYSTVCAGSGGQIRVEWDGSGFDLNAGLGVQASAVARIANCR